MLLRLPVFLGVGWLARFVLATPHARTAWSTALAGVRPLMRVESAYGLVGAIALPWASRTAGVRAMHPDAREATTLLRFRRPHLARELRTLNPGVVDPDAKPTPFWLRDSPPLVLAIVQVLVVVPEAVRPIQAH